MGKRSLCAPLLAAVIGVTAIAGCKLVVAAGAPAAPPSATGHAAASSAPGPASGGHWKLARIADEGRVTYSITLTRCRTRSGGQLPDPAARPAAWTRR